MANKSITQLQVAGPLTGLEVIPLVQNGITKQALIADIAQTVTSSTNILIDTTTTANLFPLFANIDQGNALSLYTSSPNYLFNPSTGTLTSPVVNASNGIVLNNIQINNSYTIPVGSNGLSSGPVTINAVVTVSAGSSWNIVGAVSLAPWSISHDVNKLTVKYNGVPVTSIDATGDVVAAGSITAFGAP